MDGLDAGGFDALHGLAERGAELARQVAEAWHRAVGDIPRNDADGGAATALTGHAAPAPDTPAARPARPEETATHVVRAGETLSGIAHRAGVDWHRLARANGISDPSDVRVGTVLHVPSHHQRHAHAPARPSPGGARPLDARPEARRLGDLSMRFETGFQPGQEAQAAGVVSSGAHDPGGVSYGAYQLASSDAGDRQVQQFLQAEGAPWAGRFDGLDPTARDGGFGAAWKQVANGDPQGFYAAQHAYIARTHYTPVADHVQAATGLDVSRRSMAVQDVVWSMSVQHGRAARLVEKAVQQIGSQGGLSDTAYDRKLVGALYDVRDDYVDAIGQPDLKTRYAVERRDALARLPEA